MSFVSACRARCGLFLLAAAPLAVFADADEPLLTVTANRLPLSVDETVSAVTVITRDDIDRSQAASVAELLAGSAGVSVATNGGPGQTASLFLRGTDPGHVVVLVDGVRIGSATLGTTAWENLPLEQIDRIEIVRGPQSSLYGSEAIGGVVQIFTRRGAAGTHFNAELGGGSLIDGAGSFGVSGGGDATRYAVQVGHKESGGIDTTRAANPDRDGYRESSLSARLSHRFNDSAEVALTALRSEGKSAYDNLFSPPSTDNGDFLHQSLGAELRLSPTSSWDVTLRAGQGRDHTTNASSGLAPMIFATSRDQAGWQNDFHLGDGSTLTAGVDYLDDRVSGTTRYAVADRADLGTYLQWLMEAGAHQLTAGARHDDNDSFGGHDTVHLGWGYQWRPELRLTAAYGSAFKAPTFNDLYYIDPWGSSGNPNLRPERSDSYELGLGGELAGQRWELRGYRTNVADLIQWVETFPGSWVWSPQNVARARIDGLEGSLRGEWWGWRGTAALNLLDHEDRNTSLPLARRPDRTLRLDADRDFGPWSLGGSWLLESERWDDTAKSVRVAGYGTVNLRAGYRIDRRWSLRATLDDAFDQTYRTAAGYNNPGREVFFAVRYAD